MSQAVSRRPLNAEVRLRSQVNPCEMCDGRSETGKSFPSIGYIIPSIFRWFIPVVCAYKYIDKWVCTSKTTIRALKYHTRRFMPKSTPAP